MLAALSEAMPEGGENLLTRAEFRDGWGDVLHIRLHTRAPRLGSEADRFFEQVRELIAEGIGPRRHWVEIVWSSPG